MGPESDETLAEKNPPVVSAEVDLLTRMKRSWRVSERPFTSNVPVVGPLIVFIRERWNRVAARWYVLKLLQQQNRFNSMVVEMAEIQARQGDLICDRGLSISALAEGLSRLNARVAELEEGREGKEGRGEEILRCAQNDGGMEGREGRGEGR